jgi:hypothetical protein
LLRREVADEKRLFFGDDNDNGGGGGGEKKGRVKVTARERDAFERKKRLLALAEERAATADAAAAADTLRYAMPGSYAKDDGGGVDGDKIMDALKGRYKEEIREVSEQQVGVATPRHANHVPPFRFPR